MRELRVRLLGTSAAVAGAAAAEAAIAASKDRRTPAAPPRLQEPADPRIIALVVVLSFLFLYSMKNCKLKNVEFFTAPDHR